MIEPEFEMGPGGIIVPKTAEEIAAERKLKGKAKSFIEKAVENPDAMHAALMAAAEKVEQPPIETPAAADADLVSKTRHLLDSLPTPTMDESQPTLGRHEVLFLDEMFNGPVRQIRKKPPRPFNPRRETITPAEMIAEGATPTEVESMMEAAVPEMFKYDEDLYIKELQAYVAGTYTAHYAGDDGIQAFDLIKSCGHGVGFCVGDIIKYASRFGRKDGANRKDILKILHYSLLLLHVVDTEDE